MIVGVVGLGTMGLGIAQVFAQAGFSVLATDALPAARNSATGRLRAALEPRVAKGALTAEDRDAILARVRIVDGPEALGAAELAVEAVVERLDVKQALMATLEGVMAPGAVLATNTSAIPVRRIAEGMARPGRLVGLHFFNPAPVMKLVELIAHPGTDPAALTLARAATEAAGKVVVACPDRPGFIVNRCARPFYGEALALLEEGRPAAGIDAAMVAAGYRLGPFALIDLIGADINLAATEGLVGAMEGHPRYHVFAALRRQVESGDLGRKTGRGFVHPAAPGAAPADAAAIALRIEAALVNEAAWLVAEGGVSRADVDRAMRLGLNLPRGPFESLALHGADRVAATLAALEAAAPPALKGRYLPAPGLTEAD